ncbi:hypothetical protein TNCV_2495121 [Trichonephila clavipes]|nr:hypothetical protein TNCV_2495121 [Trichonephila clavipes]
MLAGCEKDGVMPRIRKRNGIEILYKQNRGLSRRRFIVPRYCYSHWSKSNDCYAKMESIGSEGSPNTSCWISMASRH